MAKIDLPCDFTLVSQNELRVGDVIVSGAGDYFFGQGSPVRFTAQVFHLQEFRDPRGVIGFIVPITIGFSWDKKFARLGVPRYAFLNKQNDFLCQQSETFCTNIEYWGTNIPYLGNYPVGDFPIGNI